MCLQHKPLQFNNNFEGVYKELVKYLQFNGFDTVSVSTIRKIEQNAYHIRIEKKYKYIIDNLVWGYKKDEDKEC